MWIARVEIAALLFACAVCVFQTACSGDDGQADGTVDSDSDCDTDADVDGGCAAEPTVCEDIADNVDDQNFGCCFCGSVYWCDESTLSTIDCAEYDNPCGYNAEAGFMDCLD